MLFTLFQQSSIIINMDTNKGSNLFQYLRDKYGRMVLNCLEIVNLLSRKWLIIGTIDALHLSASRLGSHLSVVKLKISYNSKWPEVIKSYTKLKDNCCMIERGISTEYWICMSKIDF